MRLLHPRCSLCVVRLFERQLLATCNSQISSHPRIPCFLSIGSLLCCFIFGVYCSSIEFKPDDDGNDTTSDTLRFGPWYQQSTELVEVGVGGNTYYKTTTGCSKLQGDFDIDSKWKTVRAFTIITPIIAALLTIGLFFGTLWYYWTAASWRALASIYLIILPVFQGITFLLFESNLCKENPLINLELYTEDCQWGAGASANVVATVGWFLTGIVMLAMGAPTRPPRPPPETQTVTYQQTTNPDGTPSSVVTTTVVKGVAVDAKTHEGDDADVHAEKAL